MSEHGPGRGGRLPSKVLNPLFTLLFFFFLLPSPSWDNLTLIGEALEDGNCWSFLPVRLESSFREGEIQT